MFAKLIKTHIAWGYVKMQILTQQNWGLTCAFLTSSKVLPSLLSNKRELVLKKRRLSYTVMGNMKDSGRQIIEALGETRQKSLIEIISLEEPDLTIPYVVNVLLAHNYKSY